MARISKHKKPIIRMTRNQLSSLIVNERITTTLPKAKALKTESEALVALLAKKDDLFNLKRKVGKLLYGNAVDKALDDRSKFESVSIFKIAKRAGDNAQMAQVILNIKHAEKEIEKEKKK